MRDLFFPEFTPAPAEMIRMPAASLFVYIYFSDIWKMASALKRLVSAFKLVVELQGEYGPLKDIEPHV